MDQQISDVINEMTLNKSTNTPIIKRLCYPFLTLHTLHTIHTLHAIHIVHAVHVVHAGHTVHTVCLLHMFSICH